MTKQKNLSHTHTSEVNAPTSSHLLPLIRCEDLRVIEEHLKQYPLSIYDTDANGNSALHIAVKHQRSLPIFELLTRYGALPDALNHQGIRIIWLIKPCCIAP